MSTGVPGRDDEMPRDAMLHAALRHAPDRDALPPDAVRRAILAAARDVVAPRAPGRLAGALSALTALLRQPAAGAALASLMLGTLIVLMWQDGPPPSAERRAEPAVHGQAPAPTGAAGSAPAAVEAAPAAAHDDLQAAVRPQAGRPSAQETSDPATAPPSEPGAARKAAPAAAAAPRAMPPVVADASADAGAARPAGPPAAASARTAEAAATAPDPLASVLATLSASPSDAATLERRTLASPRRAPAAQSTAAEAPPRDADPAVWLGELRASAHGRWQRVEVGSLTDARPLRAPDGALLGRIATEGDAVLWQPAEAPGQAWRAPLPPEALARLQAALAAASPP